MHQLRRRLTPSTLIATAALIAATSGTAIAAGEIITSPDQIANGVVTEPKLADNSVTSKKIKNGAVTQDDQVNFHLRAKIARDGSIRGSQLDVLSAKRIAEGVYSVSFEGHNGKTLQDCAVTGTAESFRSDPPVFITVRTGSSLVAAVETKMPLTAAQQTLLLENGKPAPAAILQDANFDLVAAC